MKSYKRSTIVNYNSIVVVYVWYFPFSIALVLTINFARNAWNKRKIKFEKFFIELGSYLEVDFMG